MSRHTVIAASILAVGLMGAALTAGPMNPPAGPVASSYKTLSEVEPRTAVNATNTPGDASSVYRITQAGSYYLTGNISGQNAKSTIVITNNNVTLDLCGFRLLGVAGSTDGIYVNANLTNVTIKNGSVSTHGGDGIDATNADNIRVERVTTRDCDLMGIVCRVDAVVTECAAISCGSYGIVVGNRGSIRGCTANSCGNDGFNMANDGLIESCSAHLNTGDGFSGNGALRSCVATGNTATGFSGGGSFENCRAEVNGTYGFICSGSIANCSASGNGDVGIFGSGAALTGCSAYGNHGDGIEVQASRIADCMSYGNDGHGYKLSTSHASGCRAFSNGIIANNSGFLLVNGNRVDGNSSSANGGNGYLVTGTGNSITRNFSSLHGGAEYVVIAGNWAATITNTAAAGPWDNIQQ